MKIYELFTCQLYSADFICKRSGSKLLDTLMVFLKFLKSDKTNIPQKCIKLSSVQIVQQSYGSVYHRPINSGDLHVDELPQTSSADQRGSNSDVHVFL